MMGEFTECQFCTTQGDGFACVHSLQRSHMPGGIPLLPKDCRGCTIKDKPSGKVRRPPLFVRAGNFASEIAKFTSGGEFIGDEKAKARYEICKLCEPYFDDGVCNHAKCGCYLSFKVRLSTSTCPIDRWPVEPEAPKTAVETSSRCV